MAGTNGVKVNGWQPLARFDYVTGMGGVDVADQRLLSHMHSHKPMTFFWRRVFDQKLHQAISNAFLIYLAWLDVLIARVNLLLASNPGANGGSGESAGGGVQSGEAAEGGGEDAPLSKAELTEFASLIGKLRKMERATWDRKLSIHLMSMCNIGHPDQGGRRTTQQSTREKYDSSAAKNGRLCWGSEGCKAKGDGTFVRVKTEGVCWCHTCTKGQGVAKAVYLCRACSLKPEAHVFAGARLSTRTVSGKRRKLMGVDWALGKKPNE